MIDPDHNAQFGPPDKTSNFCSSSTNKGHTKAVKKRVHYVDSSDSDSDTKVLPKSKKKKTKSPVFSGIGQRVEVKYDDGVWYKGTLVNFDISSGQWQVKFDDDDEETLVKVPDKDVRLI